MAENNLAEHRAEPRNAYEDYLATGEPLLPIDWANPTAEQLLPYRQCGDPLADEAIEAIFQSGEFEAVRQLLCHLKEEETFDAVRAQARYPALSAEVVAHVQRYFVESERALRAFDAATIVEGEEFFAMHGPEILMLLATYSLPASYTAKRGVQVLAQTGRLEFDAMRRLIETTQMVVDVMTPGGLSLGLDGSPRGRGVISAQKVRLMHGAIRRLIIEVRGSEFVESFGVPINQMDLAGTLMTFSSVVLDGLAKLGVTPPPAACAAYLYSWRAIGALMGVRAELIPTTLEQARSLADVIRKAELGRSDAGVELTRVLVSTLEAEVHPRIFRGVVVALMHRFLGPYASAVELPRPNWTQFLILPLLFVSRWVDRLSERIKVLAWLERKISLAVIQVFLAVERGDNRSDFLIPDHLCERWGLSGRKS